MQNHLLGTRKLKHIKTYINSLNLKNNSDSYFPPITDEETETTQRVFLPKGIARMCQSQDSDHTSPAHLIITPSWL